MKELRIRAGSFVFGEIGYNWNIKLLRLLKIMKEVELLFKINNKKVKNLRKRLKKFFIEKIREIDTYFYPPHKDFLFTKGGRENLRVRDSNRKKELTYKKVVYKNGNYSHSIEKNVIVSDPGKTIEILKSAGFRIHLVIDKKREMFENKTFKITIDRVKNLGIFVEIEWRGDAKEKKNAIMECLKMANKLGLKKVQDKGYLRLLEEKSTLKIKK